ncbi:MAG TPA: hypothetical protein VJ741_18415 [Solirubrobacteraceae bacterium]|nr:hypothetical protein [Solirubrobacteraceae bacterium]
MTDQLADSQPRDPLDELVDQLLECGAVLSQIVGQMVRVEAAGLSAPDAAPIPEMAHGLIRDALGDLPGFHPDHDLTTAATIVEQATHAMCENIFIVPMAEMRPRPHSRSHSRSAARRSSRRRRRGR